MECGYDCTGGAVDSSDSCSTVCGDGETAGAEACDDGNTDDGDGCSSTCSIEAGFTCSGESACSLYVCSWITGNEVCGDGYILGAERDDVNFCDDGNTDDNDGCSSTCSVECGYSCSGGTASTADTCGTTCGDSIKTGAEACDDGNTP